MENNMNTVRDLIKTLKKMNPDSVVCNLQVEKGKEKFSTFLHIEEFKKVKFVDDDGVETVSDVVAIY